MQVGLCLRGEDTASVRPAAPSVCSAAGALRPAGRWHVNAWCTSFGVIISDASLTHTVPQRSMPTLQSTVVLSSTMAIDQRSVRWQGTRRARQYLSLKSEDAGFEINAFFSLYNRALTRALTDTTLWCCLSSNGFRRTCCRPRHT